MKVWPQPLLVLAARIDSLTMIDRLASQCQSFQVLGDGGSIQPKELLQNKFASYVLASWLPDSFWSSLLDCDAPSSPSHSDYPAALSLKQNLLSSVVSVVGVWCKSSANPDSLPLRCLRYMYRLIASVWHAGLVMSHCCLCLLLQFIRIGRGIGRQVCKIIQLVSILNHSTLWSMQQQQ